jgi:serine O-acetyltransferase
MTADETGPPPVPAVPPIPAQKGRAAGPVLGLRELLREDLQAHHRDLTAPGLHAIAVHRYGAWLDAENPPGRAAHCLLYRLGYLVVRNVYGIELPRTTKVGRRVKIAHQSGIVIHPDAVIGDDCVIRQNVSIGAAAGDAARFSGQAPVLGKGVSVGAGAVIVGGITIGDNAVLGPNVTVLTNVPEGARVMSPPPRVFQLPQVVRAREEQFRAGK